MAERTAPTMDGQLDALAAALNADRPASVAAAEANFIHAFKTVGLRRSLGPIYLQALHGFFARWIAADRGAVDADLAAVADDGLTVEQVGYWAEVALALGRIDAAEHRVNTSPYLIKTDLRIHDLRFRLAHYRRHGGFDPSRVGQELAGQFCGQPFQKLDILPGGACNLCCSAWMPMSAGNLFQNGAEQVWQSPTAQAMRDSILDGSYSYCSKLLCPYISGRKLADTSGPQAARTLENVRPKRLNLSYDLTCNLSCPSCRKSKIVASGAEKDQIQAITESRVMPLLADATYAEICGSGDPFASKSFRHVLANINDRDHPDLRLVIMTNGELLNEREWRRFQHLHGKIAAVNVSVDAARPDTYRQVRRGGTLERLVPNLEFLGQLYADHAFDRYKLCFVVQRRNFREIPDFIALAGRVGASGIHLQMMHDWGSYDPEVLRGEMVHLPSHPDHAEFREVLARAARVEHRLGVESDFDQFHRLSVPVPPRSKAA